MDTTEVPAAPVRVLIAVTSDPRRSGRLAEAIRMAAGVSAWQKVVVTLYVGGAAVQGLLPGAGLYVDEDNIVEFLPALIERQQAVFLEQGHELVVRRPNDLPFAALDEAGLARLVAEHDYVMRF